MVNRTSAIVRRVATAIVSVSLIAAVAGSTAAKETGPEQTRAQQVRELVLKQREKVLAQIEAIMAGQKDRSQQAASEPAEEPASADEASEPEGEASEPEGEEAEPEGAEIEEAEEAEGDEADAEAEGDEAEEGESEEEDVSELPDTGTGRSHGAETPSSPLMAALGVLAAAGIGMRRRFAQDPR